MVGQASISFGSGCCNAPSKSDEEPPVPDSSKVREIRHGLHIPLLTVATKSLASHTYSFEGLQILALVTSRLSLLSEQGDERGRMLSQDGVCHTMTPDMTCLLRERSKKNDSYHESRPVRGNPSRRLRGGALVVRTAAGLGAHLLPTRHRGRVGACGASVRVH